MFSRNYYSVCRVTRLPERRLTILGKFLTSRMSHSEDCSPEPLETVELKLPLGRIRGAKRETAYGETYYSFERIPYAVPPVGELRFRAPKPVNPWIGVLDCTRSPEKPVQKNMRTGKVEGSEDCLYLNVFTKHMDTKVKMPVMVWIYGGGFQTGRASRSHHGPDYLMREDIVLVSFNYRLCSLGFLRLDDPNLNVPGNAALKDQVLALKWVKRHIYHFNGNHNNITVFGESAGAVCTHILTLTPQTRGLFNQAILMSGCVFNYWATMAQTDMAFRLAQYHGYKQENNDKKVLEFLLALEPKKLVDHSLLNQSERRNFYWLTFAPCVEAYDTPECVLPDHPVKMLPAAWGNCIPFMMGGTSFEGLVMYQRIKNSPYIVDMVMDEPELLLPMEVKQKSSSSMLREMSKKILSLYFGKQQVNKDPKFNLMKLCSDKMFWHGLHRTAMARLRYASSCTYLYRFDFDSPTFNHHRNRFVGDDHVRGVAHADDLSYLFYLPDSEELPENSDEYKTIQRMVGMWTSFAKVANPNCEEIQPNLWKPLENMQPDLGLNISKEVSLMEVPEKELFDVWDSLYGKQLLMW